MPTTVAYEPPAIEHLSILDPDGNLDKDLEPDVPDEDLVELYETMVLSREHDLRRLKLQRQGRIGTFAPAHGQEAAQAGTIYCVRDDDWFVPAFRESVCYLWRGMDIADDLLYCAGFEEGMNIPDGAHTLPICIPIGTQYTHALGVAWAEVLQGKDRIAITYGGDGSTSEGDFHEAINMAAVQNIPVVFVIQNNQWAISVPREKQTKSQTIAQKAIAYGIPSIQVDGNDILAVIAATRKAVEHARKGNGPYLIEAVTFRMNVHTTADDPRKYRSPDEEKAWAPKDPLIRFRKYLEGKGLWDDDKEDHLKKAIKKRLDDGVKRFEERKKELETDFDGMFNFAYIDEPPYLTKQRREMAEHFEAVGGAKTEHDLHEAPHDLMRHLTGGDN